MKSLLLAACALVAVPAFAQGMPYPSEGGMQRPMMGARVVSRSEVVARTQRMFATVDSNHDGVVDQAEIAAMSKRWADRRETTGGAALPQAPRDPDERFDMIDANQDGWISRDEFARAPAMNGEREMGMRGRLAGPVRGGMGGGMARMWTMADVNRDGRVSQREANDIALRHFDMMDRNRDGRLTADEREAGRMEMREMRRQR